LTIRVKLFAILRNAAGVSDTSVELPEGATVRDAVRTLATQYPAIERHLARAAAAVNLTRASNDAALHNGDELALLPPVSGGSS
jgi:molybdopterin converting factor subunit 1